MSENSDAWWCHWSAIEIEVAVELCIGRQFRIDAGATKHVEGGFGLGNKLVPEMQGEILVNTG